MTDALTTDAEPLPLTFADEKSAGLTLRMLVRFLLGCRNAIEQVARSQQALWLGLLFVISAGFAREYDGEYLLAEPWHLLLPLAASIGSSAILFVLLWMYLLPYYREYASVVREYRRFLTLYWMTAPLAWVYAIPVERLFSAAGSVRANLLLLGLVAGWRVVLMIRILRVLYAPSVGSAAVVVLSFADVLMLAILYFTPIPVIQIMGGVRLTEAEGVLQGTAFLLGFIGVLALPVLLIALLVFTRNGWELPKHVGEFPVPVKPGVWGLAVAALLIWIPILPVTQREQSLRWQVESALESGEMEEGLAIMSAHEQSDFPPHWDPPPWTAYDYDHETLELIDIMSHLPAANANEWVTAVYAGKLIRQWRDYSFDWYWLNADDEEARRLIQIVEHLSPSVRQEFLSSAANVSTDDSMSPVKRELTERLLEMKSSQSNEPQ